MKPLIIALAVLIAAFRPVLIFRDFNPHIESGYEALAHLFVGGLVGAWWISETCGLSKLIYLLLFAWAMRSQRWQMRTASVLTLVEIGSVAVTVAIKRGLI